jgi:hypothetical protein
MTNSMRCKHDNCEIGEIAHEDISYIFEKGKFSYSTSQAGDLENIIYFECQDCGLKRKYSRWHLPK